VDGITREDLLESLVLKTTTSLSINSSVSAGKSDALIYFTHDGQFIIKTLKNEEFEFMKSKMIYQLYNHIRDTDNKSLIARFYGLFTIDFTER
jgi:hypothetical protein